MYRPLLSTSTVDLFYSNVFKISSINNWDICLKQDNAQFKWYSANLCRVCLLLLFRGNVRWPYRNFSVQDILRNLPRLKSDCYEPHQLEQVPLNREAPHFWNLPRDTICSNQPIILTHWGRDETVQAMRYYLNHWWLVYRRIYALFDLDEFTMPTYKQLPIEMCHVYVSNIVFSKWRLWHFTSTSSLRSSSAPSHQPGHFVKKNVPVM